MGTEFAGDCVASVMTFGLTSPRARARKPAALLGAVVVGAGLLASVAPDPLPPPVRTVQLDIAMTSSVGPVVGLVTEFVKTVARILLLPALPVIIGAVLYQNTATCYSNNSCGRDPLFQLSNLIIKATTALTASAVPAAAQVPTKASRVTTPRKTSAAQHHPARSTTAAAHAKAPTKFTSAKRGTGHSARY